MSRYVDPGCVSPEEGRRTVPGPDEERGARPSARIWSGWPATTTWHRPCFCSTRRRTGPTWIGPPWTEEGGSRTPRCPRGQHRGEALHQGPPAAADPARPRARVRPSHGRWQDRIGRTTLFSAAHDGPELALVRFDLEDLGQASRTLVSLSETDPVGGETTPAWFR